MPSIPETCDYVEGYIDKLSPSRESAWKAFYRLLLWYDDYNGERLPHIADVATMRRNQVWLRRARKVDAYLTRNLGVPSPVNSNVDQLMNGMGLSGVQRQNYTGTGLTCGIKVFLKKFLGLDSEMEVPVTELPGFAGAQGKIDLIVESRTDFRAVVSNKWSIRHDRMKGLFEEARDLKKVRKDLNFFLVTNEFTGRLEHSVTGENIDSVFHIHNPLLSTAGLDYRSPKLKDLTELFERLGEIFA